MDPEFDAQKAEAIVLFFVIAFSVVVLGMIVHGQAGWLP
jgi:hypothetical protein